MSAPESGCITELETENLSFRWVIKSILLFLQRQTGNAVKSSHFPPQEQGPEKWHLILKTVNDDQQYLSVYLVYLGTNRVQAEVAFSIIGANEQMFNRFTAVELFSTNASSWGFRRFIARSALETHSAQYLQEGDLVIRCELTLVRGCVSAPIKCESDGDNVPESRSSDDLGWLLDSGSHADFNVKVSGGRYRVHRAILASRSPVFRGMLSHDMLEAEEGEIVIIHTSYEVFGELLYFIYTGHSWNLRAMATSLLAAADKYCLLRLRDMCERALIERLGVHNAANALILGDPHNAPTLRRRAFELICAQGSDVVQTPGWATLVKHHAYLAEEVLRAFFGHCGDTTEPPAKRTRT